MSAQARSTRRFTFAAGHRYWVADWSPVENERKFGRLTVPHGHNYTLDVSVTGPVDPRTGYVIDLAKLKEIVRREVILKVDHRNLNVEVDFMRDIIPTTENLVVAIWRVIAVHVTPGRLTRLVLWETPNNYVEYDGG
jgi:6-pyruvoyltetrahydropterin/6-carboxytetrahydropterin synthase